MMTAVDSPPSNRFEELYECCGVEGDVAYAIHVFGDDLAKRMGYKVHRGMDAIHFYLVEKHHWKPADVRALNTEDLSFLLSEEMSGWKLPPKARVNRRS